MDRGALRPLRFMTMADQTAGFSNLRKLLEQQEEQIDKLVESSMARDKKARDIVTWVSGILVETDDANVREKLGGPHHASGKWFLEEDAVTKWLAWEHDRRHLWLRGGMGTGKSSLTSILIDKLSKCPDGVVAFFYCSRRIDADSQSSYQRNKVDNVVKSLLGQSAVSEDGTQVYNGLEKRYVRDKVKVLGGAALELSECRRIFQDLVRTQPKTRFTLVIDALDECEDYDGLLEELQSLPKADNLRFFFYSRLEVDVRRVFKHVREVTILSQNSGDINRFLDIEIPRRRDGCGITDTQIDTLRGILTARAHGM